ncbi:MAG: insulinase family protein [Alphaproteobacteria bacterium]|nr:insulinase family protein [Alphaproteobacteria bacterium]MBV9695226.1 insulinase family protein [Alphaproteobacteria bacterium]
MRTLRLAAAVALSLFAAAAPLARQMPASGDGVLRATLSNGLRVIIVRNRLAPVVATAVNYLAGGDETPPDFPGTAHAQEHMMFRGMPGLSADQLAAIGSVMGGNFNANTRESLTQYLFTVPAEDLDVALRIEALRMTAVTDSEADWQKERGAIEQEVAQDLSNPSYLLYQKLRERLFENTPYAHVALGTRPSFDKTKAAMLKSFYSRWYAPNNAILVIVGDVEPEQALKSVRAAFGAIKPRRLPPRPVFRFAPQNASRLTLDTDRPYASLVIAMRMPGMDSPDFPALEVLADVLASHRFALYDLVPQGKALDTDFSVDPLPKASVAYASASFAGGGDSASLESEMRAILRNAKRDGVSADLVEAAKLQEHRATEFQKNGIEDLAAVWSDAVALYGLRSPDEDYTRIEKVTVADVNRVLRKYLDLDHAVTALSLPKGSGAAVASSATFGGRENFGAGEVKPAALPQWANAALGKLDVPPSTLSPMVSTLPNGITLIVQPEDVSDTVSVYGHIRNRPETETAPGKEGVSLLLDQLFSYGTESLDRLAFQKALDDIGASEEAGVDFSVHALSANFERGVELLADNELRPALPGAALQTVRAQLGRLIAVRNESPAYLVSRSLRTALFPKDDPSLRDPVPQTIGALTRDDVLAYYHRVFRPDLATIVVIGKVTPQVARAAVEKYFGGWMGQGPKPQTDLPVAPPNAVASVAVPDASRVQDNVVLAQNLDLNRANPDFYALQLGNSVLAGGFYAARLSVDLRKNAGLVYSVGAQLQVGRTRGTYIVQYACDPQNVTEAAARVAAEIKAMQDAPVADDELLQSKRLLLRQIPLAESSVAAIARGMLSRRELDLPLDEPWRAAARTIALTPAEVQAAFRKWLRPGDLVRISQGPPPG